MSTYQGFHNNLLPKNTCPKKLLDQLLDGGPEGTLESSKTNLTPVYQYIEAFASNQISSKTVCKSDFGEKIIEPKLTKEARQKLSAWWPCVDLVVGIYIECALDVSRFFKLAAEQKLIICLHLKCILTPSKFESIKIDLEKTPLNSHFQIGFGKTDFAICQKRTDETLKLVTSQALKQLFRTFTKNHNINQSTNPNKFTYRKDINRMIYKHYLNREPQKDEHNQLFEIQKGVNWEWFWNATGGVKMRPDFILDLLAILEDSYFFDFYKEKIDSMVRRSLGVVDFVLKSTSGENNSDETNKVLTKLQSCQDFTNSKFPCNKHLFRSCVQTTVDRLLQFASERGMKINTPK